MTIHVVCPNGHEIEQPDYMHNRTTMCPVCGVAVRVKVGPLAAASLHSPVVPGPTWWSLFCAVFGTGVTKPTPLLWKSLGSLFGLFAILNVAAAVFVGTLLRQNSEHIRREDIAKLRGSVPGFQRESFLRNHREIEKSREIVVNSLTQLRTIYWLLEFILLASTVLFYCVMLGLFKGDHYWLCVAGSVVIMTAIPIGSILGLITLICLRDPEGQTHFQRRAIAA